MDKKLTLKEMENCKKESAMEYYTRKERERCLKAVEDEPEFNDHLLGIPISKRIGFLIKETKQNIRARILKDN